MINNIKNLLNENQDPKAIEKIAAKLDGILMTGEEVQYIAVQKKPAVNISPDCVALTNKRIIFCRPKNLGLSMTFEDFVWKDVVDCHLKEEIFGSVLSVKITSGYATMIDYLPKAQARKVYTFAQEQEEMQREIRRQREMEERRAGAGNFTVTSPSPPVSQGTATTIATPEDPISILQKLKTLFDSGLITQAEYDSKKSEVLGRM